MPLPQITWQDVQQLPDDGNRYEAIEGELYVTPAPALHHQTVSRNLFWALGHLLGGEHGRLWFAPLGVEFPATGEGVQPDLVFVSSARRRIMADRGLVGAPDLVVEILSPGTASRDRGIKRRLYERQGVAEYWIVDPVAEAVEVWRFGMPEGEGDAVSGRGRTGDEPAGGGQTREPRFERYTEWLPVWVGSKEVGTIELSEVFRRD